jgi:hypothetical protein
VGKETMARKSFVKKIRLAISRHLKEEYGNGPKNICGGIVAIIISIIIFFIYASIDDAKITDYKQIELTTPEVNYYRRRGNSGFLLKKNSTTYEIGYSLYKHLKPTSSMEATLLLNKTIIVWIDRRNQDHYTIVRGLKTSELYISPEVGLKLEKDNTKSILYLSLLFGGLGLGCMIYGFMLL